jgi:predicted acyl esterase
VEGFVRCASKQKWLEIHGQAHWTHFYTNYGISLQKRFLGHFLKGEDTGWDKQPAVQLQIRHPGEKFVLRHESEWPIARTQWTKFYLDPADNQLVETAPSGEGDVTFDALGNGVTFMLATRNEDMEITGPVAAKLFVSSTTTDADLFLVLRLFDPEGREVFFHGTNDPHTPIGLGWLRASHRKLDMDRSRFYQPYHTHDELWPLTPGETAELDVEIWPTCIVVPAGYRLALTVRGKDFEHDLQPVVQAKGDLEMRGVGPFKHDDPDDRPVEIYGGRTTLHIDKEQAPYLLLPVIPRQ